MMAYSSVLDGRERLKTVPSSCEGLSYASTWGSRPIAIEDAALSKRRAANRLWLHKEFFRNVFSISHGSISADLKIV